jgi:uncharacterized FlgJ-related protein
MFYKYNKQKLLFEPIYREIIVLGSICFIIVAFTLLSGIVVGKNITKAQIIELEGGIHILRNEDKVFSKKDLVNMIKELDIKYPYIVLAQSILETGHWTSLVFKENHNLFGMKMANKRIKTAKGTQLNHAYYSNWQESVYDYAFYQCRYLSKINSEQEYYDALDATYAEAFKYSEKLKEIIKNEKLKEIFYHE